VRVECPEEHKFEVVAEVRDHFKKEYPVIDVDGARIDFGDGWGLVRASNTTPLLVLRFEADTEARVQEIRAIVEAKVEEAMKAAGVA
jgi:phosphomannomutase/phosphoglucomutase